MPNNSERPFGRHTLKLHASFVPDGEGGALSRADVVAAVGSRPLKILGVLVPEGEPPPGHPYVSVGVFELRSDANDSTGQRAPGTQAQQPLGQGSGDSN
jgi:hypothetical protein